MSDTLLILDGIGVPLYSARGLTQTLSLIPAIGGGSGGGQNPLLRRTINGVLDDLSAPQFRKYATKITCTDQEAPAFDGVFPGMVVTIWCVVELAYPQSGSPSRPVVSGSARSQGGFNIYRPIIVCRVKDLSTLKDEWGASVGWELYGEEQ
jgi:hypothetical protein